MRNLSRKLTISFIPVALTFFAFVGTAQADIAEKALKLLDSAVAKCVKETGADVVNLMRNEVRATRSACAALRGCKKTARSDGRNCKKTCKGKKGKDLRSCRKTCRKTQSSTVKVCREVYKSTECKSARKSLVKGIGKSIINAIKNANCRSAVKNLKKLR